MQGMLRGSALLPALGEVSRTEAAALELPKGGLLPEGQTFGAR